MNIIEQNENKNIKNFIKRFIIVTIIIDECI